MGRNRIAFTLGMLLLTVALPAVARSDEPASEGATSAREVLRRTGCRWQRSRPKR